MKPKNHKFLKKLLIYFLIILVLVVIFSGSITLQETIYSLFPKSQNFISDSPILYAFLFFLLAVFSSMLSPFSSVPLVPFAIYNWGKLISLFLLLSGWVIGVFMAFLVSKYLGKPVLKYLVNVEKIENYRKMIPKKYEFWIVLLFVASFPIEIPAYTMGLTRFPVFKFLFAVFLAELPIALFTIYGSTAFLDKNFFMLIGIVLTLFLLLGIAFLTFFKKVKKFNGH